MAKILSIQAIGLKNMQSTIKLMQKYGSSIQGVEFKGDPRGKVNNAQIIEFHKKGIVRKHGQKTGLIVRDITATDDEKTKAAEKFTEKLMKVLARRNLPNVKNEGALKKIANSALSQGLKAGANLIRRAMAKRADKGKGNNKTALEPVSDKYGEYRKNKYGIPKTAVFKASGSLLANLARESYKLTKKK